MKKSAGILLYRFVPNVQFFLVHPGGPFWKNKNANAWSIPKGEFTDDEDPLIAAQREFQEETGMYINGNFLSLQPLKQKSGKMVYAWALEKDIDAGKIVSNKISIEFPPRSGKMMEIPEIDKAAWFDAADAKLHILPGQANFIEQLIQKL